AMDSFAPGTLPASKLYTGMSKKRGAGGELTAGGLGKIEEADADYGAGVKHTGSTGSIAGHGGLLHSDIRGIMSGNTNQFTGETQYPELDNLLGTTGQASGEITENKTASGVTISTTYDKSDVNFAERFQMVEGAIAQIQAAGFTVPTFR